MHLPTPRRRFGIPCWCAAAFLIAAAPAFGELPLARLTAVFPPGGKAGTSVDVTAVGLDLDGASELRFSRPGLTAKKAGDGDSQTEAKFIVAIASDVPPGVYEARVVGRFGMTNVRAFAVGVRPETLQVTSADSTAPAQSLEPDTVVNARCTANAADHYAATMKKGQRLLFECESREIDSRLSPILVLTAPDGREAARSRRGGLLDFTAPADGTYTLAVHDLLFRGGPEFYYRLCASDGPHVDAIFPPAGEPGSKAKYTLYGRNLPGGSNADVTGSDGKPLERLDVEIEMPSDPASVRKLQSRTLLGPEGAMLDGIEYRLRTDQGISNPVLIAFARARVVAEQEPNDAPDKAQKLSPPCEVAGRFYPHGDADWYTFEAAKGDSYWVEVTSDRLGLPTSPLVVVQKVTKKEPGKGDKDGPAEKVTDVQELAGTDANAGGTAFRTATRDGAFKFEAKEAGTYRVLVRNLFDTSSDNGALVYRLSIRKPDPDFRLAVLPVTAVPPGGNAAAEAAVTTPFLRKGGSVALRVVLFRQDGFVGDVRIEARDLPPGVSCPATTIPPGASDASLVLTADDKAEAAAASLRVVGKAKVGDEEVEREARPGGVVWGPPVNANNPAEPAQARLTDDLCVAVSGDEEEPLVVKAEGGPFAVEAGATLKIPVKVVRRGEGKFPVKLKAAGIAGLNGGKELTIDAGGDSGTIEFEVSKSKFPPGEYIFYAVAQAQVKYGADRAATGEGKKPDPNQKKQEPKDTQATFVSAAITFSVTAPADKKDKK